MNRKQRRALARKLHVPYATVDAALKLMKLDEMKSKILEDGQHVRLDVDKITARDNLSERFRTFVTEHKRDIFTVEQSTTDYKYIVTLAEDDTEPKWLWHADDLIVVEE